MHRIALVFSGIALAGSALAASLGGCSGGAEAPITSSPDKTLPSGSGTGSAGQGGGSGGDVGADASSTPEGGAKDAGKDGGGSSSGDTGAKPGSITCGAIECGGENGPFLNTKHCCLGAAGDSPVCTASGSCKNHQLDLRCDDSTDCVGFGGTAIEVCCLHFGPSAGNDQGTQCEIGGCLPGLGATAQVCKKNSECDNGEANPPTCNLKTCGGFPVRVCGHPPECQ